MQTYAPEHAVMQALEAQDRDAFVAAEMAEREAAGLPPFGRLAAVIVSGADAGALEAYRPGPGRRRAQRRRASRSTARPTRRWPWSAAAGASASWCAPTAAVDLQAFLAAWRARVQAAGVGAGGHRRRSLQLPVSHLPHILTGAGLASLRP